MPPSILAARTYATIDNDVRIACDPITKSFLPLKKMHRVLGDDDNCDIAVLEAAPKLLSRAETSRLQFLDLEQLRPLTNHVCIGTKLIVPGFPKSLNEVDYDNYVLHEQRYIPAGKLHSQISEDGIFLIHFDQIEHVESIDGMSGSPVFSIQEHDDMHYYGFLGMVIRGSVQSSSARFIASQVIFQALDRIFPRENRTTQA